MQILIGSDDWYGWDQNDVSQHVYEENIRMKCMIHSTALLNKGLSLKYGFIFIIQLPSTLLYLLSRGPQILLREALTFL